MTRQIWSAILAAIFVLCRPAFAAETYADLVTRAEQGDITLDYTALRLSYPLSQTYDPYALQTRALFSAAWTAYQAKDCTVAVAAARAMFKINYVSIPMHFVVGDCLQQAGDTPGAKREARIARGLAESLRGSGDGKSFATAYTVVTLSEEGFVLSLLGFTEDRQSLLDDGGHRYDFIEGKDAKTGEARSAYFNIDAVLAGMARRPDGAP